MFNKPPPIAAIEIGTAQIKMLVGRAGDDGKLEVLSCATAPSEACVVKGEPGDVGRVAITLEAVIAEAETMAETRVVPKRTFLAVSGPHIASIQGTGSVNVTAEDDFTVNAGHLREAIDNARHVRLNSARIINTIESYFYIDGNEGRKIQNPVGQSAKTLWANVHIIHGDINRLDTYQTLMSECGFDDTAPIVFSGAATAFGLLTEIERRNGALLIDMGAGCSEYFLVHGNGAYASGVLPIGCEHIANDLAIALDLSIARCRKIINEGKFAGQPHIEEQSLRVNRRIPSSSIEKVIELRLEEAFNIIKRQCGAESLSRVHSGIVLSGGGAMIPGAAEIAGHCFNAPVRTGAPHGVVGAATGITDDPRFSTVWGLLNHGWQNLSGGDSDNGWINQTINLLDNFSAEMLNYFRSIGKAIKF